MTHHSELLNLIAEKIKAKSYIEIGVFNPDHNFNLIDVEIKIGVDPDPNARATLGLTSDQFFHICNTKADLYLIDGLHYADQVKKDILNAFYQLNHGGVIVCHDSNPPTEDTTCIPRRSQREWCGDTFKTICKIVSPDFFTVDADYGCAVIRKGNSPLVFRKEEITWEGFDKNRKELLNLKSIDESIQIINSWM